MSPLSGATGVLIGSNVVVTFDEAVTVAGNWAQLVCTTSGTRSVGAGTLAVTDADPVFTLNPTVDLTAGESCTLTVFAMQVTDDDAIDPPNTMPVDFTSNFVTQDLAPQITGTTPVAAAVVNQNQTLTLNFSESVDVAAGAINWSCGGAVAFTRRCRRTVSPAWC
ncbi:MAG: Ig-like domain-containing protein [Xanthomonadales bacterium]|nr:Ig-like domain-containing protein [Xanthomonadales bacterium]